MRTLSGNFSHIFKGVEIYQDCIEALDVIARFSHHVRKTVAPF